MRLSNWTLMCMINMGYNFKCCWHKYRNQNTSVSGCFSFCLNQCSFEIISETEINFVRRQPFTSFQTWLPQVWGNVNLNNIPTFDGVWVLVCPEILWILWLSWQKTMKDVMPCCCKGRWYAFCRHYCHMIVWQMENHRGICCNLLLSKVADVIAIMLMCGRW